MCYNGTFRFKKLDDSFWNGETFRFADYTYSPHIAKKGGRTTASSFFSYMYVKLFCQPHKGSCFILQSCC